MSAQSMKALARGNEVRLARGTLKRKIKAGETPCSEVLKEHPVPADLATMRVEELLDSVPRLQTTIIHSWLHSIPIKLTANLGDLTYRKRRILADLLDKWEAQPKGKENGRRARIHPMARRHTHLEPLDTRPDGQR
jgi:hypothetical protein